MTTTTTRALPPGQYLDANGNIIIPIGTSCALATEYPPMTVDQWQTRSRTWNKSPCEVSRFVHDCVNALIDMQQQNAVLTQYVRELRQRVEQLEHQAHVHIPVQ